MKSKNTVINNIFSKIAKGKETELNSHKVDLSLATDIEKAYKKVLGRQSDLEFAAEKYKQIAMDQSDLWEETMDAELEKNKAEAKHAQLKKDLESFSKNTETREGDYRNSLQDANQLLKELSGLEKKANKIVKELGIPPTQFPPLMNALNGQNELITAITQAKSTTQGIG